MKCVYFTLVGTSPLAVQNSLVWFLKRSADVEIEEVQFICSRDDPATNTRGTRTLIPEIIEGIKEQLNALNLGHKIRFGAEKIIEIEEADLPQSSEIIGKHLLTNPEQARIILDCTAGRKTMTGAALIAGLYIKNKFKRDIVFVYYWLLTYNQEFLRKRAIELGDDQAEMKIFDANKIEDALERIGS